MKRTFYTELSKVFGVLLVLIGAAALIGGSFSHNYVTGQLKQEGISMPTQQGVDALTEQASKDALAPYVGEKLTTGTQAELYANHYIWQHMQSAAKNFKTTDGKALAPEQYNYAGIGDFSNVVKAVLKAQGLSDTEINAHPDVVALNALRASNFQGDTLRGMLLNAYAWWLIGTIAIWVGVAALVLGAALLAFGLLRKPAVEPEVTPLSRQ